MKTLLCVLAATALGGFSTRADESAPLTKSHLTDFSEFHAGKFGAGVMFGEPAGGTVKYFLNDSLALDAAAGWSFRDDTYLYLHSDVLWHNFDLIPVANGRLPVYFGVGGLARFRNHGRDDEVGVRLPIGVSYLFERAPVDVYVEFAPAIDVAPSVRSDFTGGFGIRYWF